MTKEKLAQRIKDSDYTCKGINCTECINVNGFGCCLQADRKLFVSMILSKNKKSDDKEKIQNMNDYRSIKDALPPSDGIFYDVMVILYQDNISGGWNYYRGLYQNGFFFADKGIYQLKNDFRCSWTQQKVIAWKFLEKCTNEQIDEFREKAGCL